MYGSNAIDTILQAKYKCEKIQHIDPKKEKSIYNLTKQQAEEIIKIIQGFDVAVYEELFIKQFTGISAIDKQVLQRIIEKKLIETLTTYLEKYNNFINTRAILQDEEETANFLFSFL